MRKKGNERKGDLVILEGLDQAVRSVRSHNKVSATKPRINNSNDDDLANVLRTMI